MGESVLLNPILDFNQSIVQFLCDLVGLPILELILFDLSVLKLPLDGLDAVNDDCSASAESLSDLPLLDSGKDFPHIELNLLALKAKLLADVKDGLAGDAREDHGVEGRGHELGVGLAAGHEEDVGGPDLADPALVGPQGLVAFEEGDAPQLLDGRPVVRPDLVLAGPVGRTADGPLLAEQHGRLEPSCVVRAHWRPHHVQQRLAGRPHPHLVLRRDKGRPQVQAVAELRRHELLLHLYELFDAGEQLLPVKVGQADVAGR